MSIRNSAILSRLKAKESVAMTICTPKVNVNYRNVHFLAKVTKSIRYYSHILYRSLVKDNGMCDGR